MDRLNLTIQLRDGQTLGYAEYGMPEGTTVFYFTGGKSARSVVGVPQMIPAHTDTD